VGETREAARSRETLNIAGMYGGLQGLLPALPGISALELTPAEADAA
jgi:hypothetical protein